MKKKKGFTLAEVLITLGIVGVVAALTLPTMTQNVQSQKIGPTLAKAVNTLENANANLLKNKEMRNIKDACNGTDDYVDYLNCLYRDSNITGFVGSGAFYSVSSYDSCLQTKDGIAFCTKKEQGLVEGSPSRQFYGKAIQLAIDINGPTNKPNKIGVDTFIFKVDLQGQLIPVGSKLESAYLGRTSSRDWETTCNKTSVTTPANCAGSIADNDWKVIYKLANVPLYPIMNTSPVTPPTILPVTPPPTPTPTPSDSGTSIPAPGTSIPNPYPRIPKT